LTEFEGGLPSVRGVFNCHVLVRHLVLAFYVTLSLVRSFDISRCLLSGVVCLMFVAVVDSPVWTCSIFTLTVVTFVYAHANKEYLLVCQNVDVVEVVVSCIACCDVV